MITLDEFKVCMSEGKCGDLNCGECYPMDSVDVQIKRIYADIDRLKAKLSALIEERSKKSPKVVLNGTNPKDINVTVRPCGNVLLIKCGVWNLLTLSKDGVRLMTSVPSDLGFELTGDRLALPGIDKEKK
jgi:hypothetical protein